MSVVNIKQTITLKTFATKSVEIAMNFVLVYFIK